MKFPLRSKLILAICLPLLAIYLGILAIDYHTGRRQAIAQMMRHLSEGTARMASEVDQELMAVRQTVRNAAALMSDFPLEDQQQIDTLLRSNVRDTPAAFGAAIAYEPGAFQPGRERYARYVCRSAGNSSLKTGDIPYDYARWDWYLLPKLLERPAWTDPYFDEGAGDVLMCTCSGPFYQDNGFRGVVTVDVALDHLRQRLRKIDTSGGYAVIVSQAGTYVSHPDESHVMAESIFSISQWHQSPELASLGREMTAGRRGVRRLLDVETGVPVWVVYAPIASVGWSVAAVLPETQVMADVFQRLNRHAGLLLGGLVAIVAVIALAATWITGPIARLSTAVQQLAKGNLEVQLPAMRGGDEISGFANTFNMMVGDLKRSIDERIRETAARESIERELQVARQIQTSLMPMIRPAFPDRQEFTLDAHTEPAKIMAGDFFDFWLVDHDVLAVVVADVSGKGVPAAMFMAVARTILRSFSTAARSPGEVLTIANRIMAADNEEQMFVTVFYAHYRIQTGELTFANGGHNPPYIVRPGGEVICLGPSTGPLVGVFEEAEFDDAHARLAPHDTLVVFSDGVTEAADAEGVLYGDQRLMDLLSTICNGAVEEIRERILKEVNDYRQNQDQDDVTLLVLKRQTPDS